MKSKKYDDLFNELQNLAITVAAKEKSSQTENEKLKQLLNRVRELLEFLDENSMDLASVIGDLSEDKKHMEATGMEIISELGEMNESYQKERSNMMRAITLLEDNGIEIAKNFGELYEEKLKLEMSARKKA